MFSASGRISFLLIAAATIAPAGIVSNRNRIELTAGPLRRTIEARLNVVRTTALSVAGRALITGPSDDSLLVVSYASPNRKPAALKADAIAPVDWERNEPDTTQAAGVTWTGAVSPVLGRTAHEVTHPSPGVTRAVIVASSSDPALTISTYYEVYDGYPAIRKWIEVKNTGSRWLKIDRLTIDNVHLSKAFGDRVALTPAERGAGSSVIAFSAEDRSAGIIAGSEIPSALRRIDDDGAMGYREQHFEWVLGPGEAFQSEPVFHFAFSGDVEKTVSSVSLPLDRALEGPFRRFLVEKVGVAASIRNLPAPQWVSWSNFRDSIDDAIVREQAAIAAKAGFALISLDQGWQEGLLGAKPDPKKFPDFEATVSFVRSLGLRLGLWVSSFRTPGSPDLMALPGAPIVPKRTRQGGYAMSFASDWRDFYARDLAAVANRYGITYFKQDFTNIRFGDIAEGHYGRTRKESILRGLRGLLEAQDRIRKEAPEVTTRLLTRFTGARPECRATSPR